MGSPAAAVGTQMMGGMITGLGTLFAAIAGVGFGAANHNPALGWGVFAAATASAGALAHGPLARRIFRRAHRALSQSEIEELAARSSDELTRAYLQLARDSVLAEVPEEAGARIREALEALGDAISGLPAVIVEVLDTESLRAQAGALRERVAAEDDRITRESLERQAESLEQRAESHERSALASRRSVALRDEALAKIAALREAIAAQQLGVADASALAALSESARSIAREAQNTASAQDELTGYLAAPEAPTVQQNRH